MPSQAIWKGFLRLDLQPVQLIFPTSITDKTMHQPSNDIIFQPYVVLVSRFKIVVRIARARFIYFRTESLARNFP